MTKMQAASLSELVRMALIAGLPEAGLQILHDPSPMSRGRLMGGAQLRKIKALPADLVLYVDLVPYCGPGLE